MEIIVRNKVFAGSYEQAYQVMLKELDEKGYKIVGTTELRQTRNYVTGFCINNEVPFEWSYEASVAQKEK